MCSFWITLRRYVVWYEKKSVWEKSEHSLPLTRASLPQCHIITTHTHAQTLLLTSTTAGGGLPQYSFSIRPQGNLCAVISLFRQDPGLACELSPCHRSRRGTGATILEGNNMEVDPGVLLFSDCSLSCFGNTHRCRRSHQTGKLHARSIVNMSMCAPAAVPWPAARNGVTRSSTSQDTNL